MADAPTRSPKKTITPGAWQEARALIYAHRGRLAVGLALMPVNRLAVLVRPSASKWALDRASNQPHPELAGRAVLPELAAHPARDPAPRLLRGRHGVRVRQAAAAVPRSRQAHRGRDGAAGRDAWRHPHRQGVSRGAQRAARVHPWGQY